MFPILSRHVAGCCRLLLVLLLCGALAGIAQAQADGSVLPEVQDQLDQAEKALAEAQRAVDDAKEPEAFNQISDSVLQVQREAQAAVRALSPALEQVQARLKPLGEAQKDESRDIAGERKALQQQQNALDSAKKRGELLALEATQFGESLERTRVQRFNERLTLRVASPLSPALWKLLAAQSELDRGKLRAVNASALKAVREAVAERGYGLLATGVAVALLLVFPLRLLLRHLGRRFAATRAPGGRLRRSGLALWLLLVGTLSVGLAALVLMQCLRAIGAVPARLDPLADAFVTASFVAAFIGSLSASLLMPRQPSWRLFAIDDDTAIRLGRQCHAVAVLTWICGLALAVHQVARVGTALLTATDGVAALLYIGLILLTLGGLSLRARAARVGDAEANAAVTSRGSGVIVLVRLLGHLTVVTALVAALFGYINFALFLTRQIVWVVLVWSLVALLMAFAADLIAWVFKPEGRFSRALSHVAGLRAGRLVQLGVLLSAVVRTLLVLGGLGALLLPYGTNLSMFAGWTDALVQGVRLGKDLVITPSGIVKAVGVLVIGMGLVNLFQRWLTHTYLPETELDAGARNSVSTVSRYIGLLLVVLWTLAALGVGLGQLALVLSALSVGIGFGLQAITQNFVSGLILLAERPVKIGDWVRIGDQEGDIRKINVRATEIQVGDRSTLIVPNSELITKSVRNMTLSNPKGRVQLQFSVPLDTDVEHVRTLLLRLFGEHPKVLEDPAPSVFIDSIAAGQVAFNSFCYVSSPRDAYGVRSDLFFALLQRMASEGIELQSPQDIRISGAAALQAAGGLQPEPQPPAA